MKKLLAGLLGALLCATGFAQTQAISNKHPLTYYLPDIEYNTQIPTPEQFFGFQIGEWHLSHDLQYRYMQALAAASPRVQLVEYARSHEYRPLVYLIITSEENHRNIETIKAQHQALCDPGRSSSVNITNTPAVLYQGFSIHGNEPSGGNAAPLVAYYLAAAKGATVEKLLSETVILLDPCFNPDGFNRFASWANTHKNKNLTPDPNDREYNEAWPRGRTNHYWFDLNRDWLPLQHPESQGRVKAFHEWKPNVLTDHHEMGTNATFFFMPGVPERTNPITPWRNQELTAKIGTYHAAALDKIGSLYYTEEGFDDFYYGKGSTYPDANGAIGILFEQASSRGHVQESINGLLTFPFTIRNQVTTALSTHQAVLEMREELLDFQREFYKTGLEEARADNRKAYVFGDTYDLAKMDHFIEILRRHQIEVYPLRDRITVGGRSFDPANTYIVPTEQAQYRLIRGIFETMIKFQDSLFYDISTWTMPLAFNIPYAALDKNTYKNSLLGNKIIGLRPERQVPQVQRSAYAYLMEWDDFYAPKALNYLLANGLRAKVATKPFTLEQRQYTYGTILIPAQNQEKTADEIYQIVQQAAQKSGTPIRAVGTGLTPAGIDLGSNNFAALKEPKILLLVDGGVNNNDAGEAWHVLDQRYDIPVTKGSIEAFARFDLNRYTVIVMVDGNYNTIAQNGVDNLRQWIQNGGTVVAMQGAVQWLRGKGLSAVEFKRTAENNSPARRPYVALENDRGAEQLGGAIFEATLDLTHPIGYGYRQEKIAVFRQGASFMETGRNAYATPLLHTDSPLLSGYINRRNLDTIKGSAVVVVSGVGSGKVVSIADNPNFRAFWFGTNKLFANAIFFGHIISSAAADRPAPAGQRE
ncbi:MAG TPA: M14 family metallopeptidase [Saprospiraceae bacterium]|nr:M14 family metallopeptidase [Saprospiraceae bacterium]